MITAKLLRDWDACENWPDARIADHLAGRTGVSPRDVAADESIALDDRLWVLCRALWYRSESAARTFAIDSAALVSHLAGEVRDQAEHARLVADLRRIYSLPVAERAKEMCIWDAAWDAAWAAAWAAASTAVWAAASTAARAAAWDAAWAAASTAVWAAASTAVWAAASTAAWDAARDAELRKAIDRALVALGPDADGWTS